jgi:hypothetical protein
MLRSLAIGSFLFAGAVSVANADVFRWVDEHGGVHYSDQWVPGSELIKSTKPRPPSTTSADTARRAPEAPKPPPSTARNSGDQGTVAQAMKQDLTKVREQQCKEAKERYDKAIQARHIYKPTGGDKNKDNPDEREYLSDEEADAYRVKVRQAVDDYCGSSAK